MAPIASNAHYHIVDNIVHISDNVVGLLTRDVIRVIGLQLFEHELIEK